MTTYVGPFPLVLPTGVKQNGSDVFNILDPDSGGAATFSVALSADGLSPATFWGANSLLEQDTYDALTLMTTTQFKAYVDELAVIRGREPVGPITPFKNSIQIGDEGQDFNEFCMAQGLQQIQVNP